MSRPLGYKHTEETKQKMRLSKLGDKNPSWKGDNVGYHKLHEWVRNRLSQPDECKICMIKKSFLDLSNKTGIYNRDLNNWWYLCRSCHMNYDYETGLRDPYVRV